MIGAEIENGLPVGLHGSTQGVMVSDSTEFTKHTSITDMDLRVLVTVFRCGYV